MTKAPGWDEKNAHCDSTKGMTDADEVPLPKVNSGAGIGTSQEKLVHASGVLFARDWGEKQNERGG